MVLKALQEKLLAAQQERTLFRKDFTEKKDTMLAQAHAKCLIFREMRHKRLEKIKLIDIVPPQKTLSPTHLQRLSDYKNQFLTSIEKNTSYSEVLLELAKESLPIFKKLYDSINLYTALTQKISSITTAINTQTLRLNDAYNQKDVELTQKIELINLEIKLYKSLIKNQASFNIPAEVKTAVLAAYPLMSLQHRQGDKENNIPLSCSQMVYK